MLKLAALLGMPVCTRTYHGPANQLALISRHDPEYVPLHHRGIWLGVVGNWGLIGVGIAAMLLSTFGLGLALAPGLIFSAPAEIALEKGKTVIAGVLLALGNLWTCAVVTVWCLGSFYVVFAHYETGSIWPYLLWAYTTATGLGRTWLREKGEIQ
jgi:hypothetical protein